MNSWWQYIPGLDPSSLPERAEVEFIWQYPPGPWLSWLIVLLAGLCVTGVLVMYRREAAACPRWLRRVLAGIRASVIVTLALVFMGPALGVYQRQIMEPVILVLVDDSASMSVVDQAPVPTADSSTGGMLPEDASAWSKLDRRQRVARLLQAGDSSLLDQLQSRGRVVVRTFADRLEPALAAGEVVSLSAQGPSTDLATALREGIRELGRSPLAAVVLISDGQVTAGDDPRPQAQALGAAGVPLLVVGVGQVESPRRWRVAEVWARETVWRGDPFTVEAQLVGSGTPAVSLTVELWQQQVGEPSTAAQKVATQTVGFDSADSQHQVTFQHVAPGAGRYLYSARIAQDSAAYVGEADLSSVSATAMVEVVEEQARVLLISGRPGWDFQALKNLLLRERSVKLSVWLQSLAPSLPQEGTLRLESLPGTPDALLAYDLVILMDPMLDLSSSGTAMAIPTQWLALLERLVGEQGGGLLFVPGPVHSARWIQQPLAEPLRNMLPVTFVMDQSLDLEGLVRPPIRPWPMRLTAEAADHPILRLSHTSASERRGTELAAGVYWSFPAQGVRPGSRVLIEHSDPALRSAEGPRPLLVTGQFGPGRTLYLGLDSTWRWRSLGHDSEYFDRFWMQCVRYLVEGRRLTGARRGTLTLSADHFPIGATVTLGARLFDATYAPLNQPTVAAQLRSPGREPVDMSLRAIPERPGQYETAFTLRHQGPHEIVVDLGTDARGQPIFLTRRFHVEVPRIEFVDIRQNQALLQSLAEQSQGHYYDLSQAPALVGNVPDRTQMRVLPSRPIPLWDTWMVLCLLTALLGVEWIVRKRQRMM